MHKSPFRQVQVLHLITTLATHTSIRKATLLQPALHPRKNKAVCSEVRICTICNPEEPREQSLCQKSYTGNCAHVRNALQLPKRGTGGSLRAESNSRRRSIFSSDSFPDERKDESGSVLLRAFRFQPCL